MRQSLAASEAGGRRTDMVSEGCNDGYGSEAGHVNDQDGLTSEDGLVMLQLLGKMVGCEVRERDDCQSPVCVQRLWIQLTCLEKANVS